MNLQNKSNLTRFERKLKSDLQQKPYNSEMNYKISIFSNGIGLYYVL